MIAFITGARTVDEKWRLMNTEKYSAKRYISFICVEISSSTVPAAALHRNSHSAFLHKDK
jgi:hypothetical protein